MSKILVTGATGNVGKHVVSLLADAGIPVAGLSRNPGEHGVRGDLNAPETLEPALEDVESVFLLWPGFDVEKAAPVIDLIARHARRIVYLSANTHGQTFHGEIERLIEHSGLAWTFLRPGGFATNTLGFADQIRTGVVRWPYGQAGRSLIHEKDIAEVAAHVLTSAGHNGLKYVLSGPEVLTQAEQVQVIGDVVGREVRWEELTPEVAREELLAAWGNAEFVDMALKAWGGFVDSPELPTGTVEALTGRKPRTFREWAVDHADAFR